MIQDHYMYVIQDP